MLLEVPEKRPMKRLLSLFRLKRAPSTPSNARIDRGKETGACKPSTGAACGRVDASQTTSAAPQTTYLAPTACQIASKTGAHLLIRARSTSNDMASLSNNMARRGSDRPTMPLARPPIRFTAVWAACASAPPHARLTTPCRRRRALPTTSGLHEIGCQTLFRRRPSRTVP